MVACELPLWIGNDELTDLGLVLKLYCSVSLEGLLSNGGGTAHASVLSPGPLRSNANHKNI